MRLVMTAVAVVALNVSSAHPVNARAIETPISHEAPVDRGVLEQHALALSDEIETIQGLLKSAVEAAQGDAAEAEHRVDTILATFQPRLDSFLDAYNRFQDGLLENAHDEEARLALQTGREESVRALKAIPRTLREKALNPDVETPATTD